jgi:hypothetical protein
MKIRITITTTMMITIMIIFVRTVIITIIRWISSEVLAPCSILLGIWQIHGNFIKTHGWSTGAKFSGQQSWWLERAMPGAVNTKFGVLGLLPLHNLPWNSDPLAWNTWHHLESGPWCVNRQSILQWALIPWSKFSARLQAFPWTRRASR